MGQKVNPYGIRLGINKTWSSRWFSKNQYTKLLHQDLRIKNYVEKKLKNASISKINIERAAKKFLTLANCKTFSPPSKIPAVESKLLWHDRSHNDPACEWFRNKVSEIAKEVGAG